MEKEYELVRNGYKEFANNSFCDGECSGSSGSNSNIVAYKVEAKEQLNETYQIDFGLQNTNVIFAQEKGPEATFNEENAEIEVEPGVKRLNALYKAQSERGKDPWLGPYVSTASRSRHMIPVWCGVGGSGFRLVQAGRADLRRGQVQWGAVQGELQYGHHL